MAGSVGSFSTGIGVQTTFAQLNGEDKVEIVTAKVDGEPIEIVEVPRSWYKQVKATQRVQKRLGDNLGDKPWVKRISRTKSDKEVAGRSGRQVVVYFDEKEVDQSWVRSELPAEREGVDISVEKGTEFEVCDYDGWCDENRKYTTFDCMPGGSSKQVEKVDDPSEIGNSSFGAPAVHDTDNCFLTDAHSFIEDDDNYCTRSINGAWVRHGDEDRGNEELIVGEVIDHDWSMDMSVVKLTSDAEVDGVDNIIWSRDDDDVDVEGETIRGHVTEIGLEEMEEQNETLYKTGRTSGQTMGTINEIHDDYNWSSCGGSTFVESSVCVQPGDSGSVYYRRYYDNYTEQFQIQIVGIVSHRNSDGPVSRGGTAYEAASELGVSFHPSNCS